MRRKRNFVIQQSAYESKQDSLSLHDDSVIEEYEGLDFSDENAENDEFSSEDAQNQQLTQEQLKFLGVNQFPPQFRIDFTNNSDNTFQESNTREQSHLINRMRKKRSYHKKSKQSQQKSSSRQESSEEQSQNNINNFKIDSFLNSQVIPFRANKSCAHKKIVDSKKIFQKSHWREKSLNYDSRNDESETLITLPEAPQKLSMHKGKKNKNNDALTSQLFSLRFEEAKINFMDTFLPESMKIGNNAFRYWKYTNTKQRGLARMI